MSDQHNTVHAIEGLKDFQLKTVEYVFRALFDEASKVRRFLIADEVGLGKTHVARGVITKTIEQLNMRDRIDILYICSNENIARQNIGRLTSANAEKAVRPTRLTLLPIEISKLKRINFISLTPETSFRLTERSRVEERALIYTLLKAVWQPSDQTAQELFTVLKGGVKDDTWRYEVDKLADFQPEQVFKEKFRQNLNLLNIDNDFTDLVQKYVNRNKITDLKYKRERAKLIGLLRTQLAYSCVDSLTPALVILDEFQRFPELLDKNSDMGKLAAKLFCPEVRVLLLSATPYKMYTMHNEEATADHYKELLKVVEFLFDSPKEKEQFQQSLADYGRALRNFSPEQPNALLKAKTEIEERLRRVMVRNERVGFSKDHNAMLEGVEEMPRLKVGDLQAFALFDKVAKELRAGEVVEYWMAAPYLLNFMERDYKLKKEFAKAILSKKNNKELTSIIKIETNAFLPWKKIERYQKIEFGNARLRKLVEKYIANGAWKLLWIPPSLPYYKVKSGPYADKDLKNFTKVLVFSAWKVVPKAVATLCSYEAERHMVTLEDKNTERQKNVSNKYQPHNNERPKLHNYKKMPKKVGALRFSGKQKDYSMMVNLNLLYPCLTLSRAIEPWKFRFEEPANPSLPTVNRALRIAQKKIAQLMKPVLEKYSDASSPIDKNWYWASLLLLDREYHESVVREWLKSKHFS